jgi:hypothetical protein
VLLVEEEPEEVVLTEELDDVPRELVALVDLGGAGRDPLARQPADKVADLALFFRQRLVRHAAKSISQSLVGQYVASAAATISSKRITTVVMSPLTSHACRKFRDLGDDLQCLK